VPPLDSGRVHGAIRTALITYGVAVFTYLFTRHDSGASAEVLGSGVSARFVVLGGIVLQLLLIAVRALIKRYAPDRSSAVQGFMILELIGDGVTVLLFALGTFGAIMHGTDDI
jgi:hypothetical protein